MIFDDLRSIITKRMQTLGMPFEEKWDTHYLCVKYYDTIRRFCFFYSPVAVHFSKEISSRTLNDTEKRAFDDIRHRLETGRSIFPYLSRSVNLTDFEKSDFCMKNWNIFHAHLGRLPANALQCHRSDRLLFFTYKDKEVFFIDVKKHPKGAGWFDRELIMIIYRNWPELLIELPGVKPTGESLIPDENYFELSKYAIVPIQIDDKMIVPTNFGDTTSGDSQMAVEQTDLFFMTLCRYSACELRDMGDCFCILTHDPAKPPVRISNLWSKKII